MFKKLFGKPRTPDNLVSACRGEDRQKFVELFGRTQIFFICLPPGLEKGIDPGITKEALLENIRTVAKGFSEQERFEPYWYVKGSQRRMPLFTDQSFVQEFARAYVRETKRITPFQVLGIDGTIAARALGNADVVVLNDGTTSEYELSPEDIRLIRQRWLS